MSPASVPTALIAEDEPLLAQGLREQLARLWPELRIVADTRDGAGALEAALQLAPSVAFLDVRMPALDGLQVAQALAEDWPEADAARFPLLVFVTAYDEYALHAFEAQAVDYLLKPVTEARLALCVERLRRRLALQGGAADGLPGTIEHLRALLALPQTPAAAPTRLRLIQAGHGADVHLVPVDDVVYFEAADKYVRVVTDGREHLIRTALRELLPQLDPERFWQVHRGLVVQAERIARAVRHDSGKLTLSLHGRSETLVASRLYAHRFKPM